jgi:flagellar biosynthesis protein FlhG
MRDDQATGLRRLFARTPHHTVAVCGSDSARVTVKLAEALAGLGHRVLILDRTVGEVARALGTPARYDLMHVLEGDKAIGDVLLARIAGDPRVVALPAARGLAHLAVASSDWLGALRAAVPTLVGEFDVWLLHGLLPGAAPQVPVVLVVAPTARAITTAYAQIKALSRAQDRHDFGVLVHRAPDAETARKVFACVAVTAARFLAAHLELLGSLPRERTSTREPATPGGSALPQTFTAVAEALLLNLHADAGQPALHAA